MLLYLLLKFSQWYFKPLFCHTFCSHFCADFNMYLVSFSIALLFFWVKLRCHKIWVIKWGIQFLISIHMFWTGFNDIHVPCVIAGVDIHHSVESEKYSFPWAYNYVTVVVQVCRSTVIDLFERKVFILLHKE